MRAGLLEPIDEFMVIAVRAFDDWCGRMITVRWEEPCAWHASPCVHVHIVTHSTAWEWTEIVS